ncbi:MAG: hypothetical protein GY708_16625 [Actinomycetia bacterium]|nr:hypothetical protein [Actinomycetes bacterium]MCP4959692.1 hypothetical protein [Actinomycetes bacterium]
MSTGSSSDSAPRRHLSLVIDCDICIARRTDACNDCMVSYLVKRREDEAVVIDLAEARALRTLGAGGLVPRLRHRVEQRPSTMGE